MSAPMTSDNTQDAAALMAVRSSAWLGRIVCGDNTEVLSGFPDACIDLVVTSPPYDDLRTYGGHSWNFETLAAQLVRVLKPGGVIVWVVADKTVDGSESGTSMRQALGFMDASLRLHDTMIFRRKTHPLYHRRYEQEFEFMFVLSKGAPKAWNGLMRKSAQAGVVRRNAAHRNGDDIEKRGTGKATPEMVLRGNIWDYNVGGPMAEAVAFEHPAIFPEALAKDHIASWSNPGDVVLDPFSGSGTTCKAAKELNRQWCGIEINPEYVKIAQQRLAQDVLQLETCHAP
jgi:site-specific DNA-methyltransferase (adenine-specific)